ncbi:MAG: hypothetical protein COB85_08270 [Bacteroidetes bacterium]|nr:MAG: hypothetical protein COB85_08270 [Bacteroidota bacterium]
MFVQNYGCINSEVIFSGDVSGNWNFGAGAVPSTGFGNGPFSVVYATMGRKTIMYDNVPFTEFIDIFRTGPPVPSITASSDTITLGCPAIFTSSIVSTNYEWIFGPVANPDSLNGPGFQTTDTVFYTTLGSHLVELWLNDYCCGRVRDTFNVYIDASLLNVSLSALYDTICLGDTQVFTAGTGYTNYDFYFNSILVQSSPSNVFTTTTLQTGDIVKVIAFDGTCYSNQSSAITPVVIPIPPVNITISDPDTIICQFESVTFTASPSTYSNYEFFVGTTSVQNGPGNIYTTNSLNDGDSITCVSYLGCPGPPSNTIYFTVNALPVITLSSSDTVFCQGDTVTLTASPPGMADYEIIVNGFSAGSGSSNTVTTDLFSDGDSIFVVATSPEGCVGFPSNDLVLTVNPIPSVTLVGSSDTVCLNATATFTASPTGLDNYEFFDGVVSLQSGPGNQLATSALSAGNHSITVVVTDLGCASPASTVVLLTVLSGPPVSITSSSDTLCLGDTITYTALLNSFANYEFFNAGTSLQDSTLFTYSTSGLSAGDSIYVIATDQGCPGPLSNIIVPLVNPLPSIILTSSDSDLTICAGDVITILSSPQGMANYDYYLNGSLVQSGTDSNYVTSTLVDGDAITVIAISIDGCTGPLNNSLVYTVNPIPPISLTSSDDSVCYGSTIVFTAAPGSYANYEFFNNGASVQNGSSDTYAPDSLDSGNVITVIATNLNCPSLVSNDTSVTVIYGPTTILISSDADSTICAGDVVTFTATPNTFDNYNFYVNGGLVQSGSTNTYVSNSLSDQDVVTTVGSILGCPGPTSNGIPTTVNPIPASAIVNNQANICFNDSNTFTATPTGLNSYTFYVNGVLQQQDTVNVFTTAPIFDGDAVTVITEALGCLSDTSNVVYASVYPLPIPGFVSDTVCQGEFTTLTDTTQGNIINRLWAYGDGDTSFGQPADPHVYQTSGSFTAWLIVTNSLDCKDSTSTTVIVNPLPIADFTAVPDTTTILSPEVSFTDMSSPPGSDTIISWMWDFDDGTIIGPDVGTIMNVDSTSGTYQNPIHEYQDSGVYEVVLTVMNQYMCSANTVLSVVINPEFILHIPNSFTPNGDGINDFFAPVGIGLNNSFEFYIYDRWGDLIFKTFDANVAWDGKANNGKKIARQEVYVWLIYLRDHKGQQHEFVGHVTLIR